MFLCTIKFHRARINCSKFSSFNAMCWLCAAPLEFLKCRSSFMSVWFGSSQETKGSTFAFATCNPSKIFSLNSPVFPPQGFSLMSPFRAVILKWYSASTSSGPAFDGGMTEVPSLEGMEENEVSTKETQLVMGVVDEKLVVLSGTRKRGITLIQKWHALQEPLIYFFSYSNLDT